MKKKSFLAFMMAAACVVALPAYADDDDDDDDRRKTTVAVEGIGAFENIISNAPFDIEFTQAGQQQINVYGAPSQVDNVSVSLVGKTLYVAAKENRPTNHVEVRITAPDLLCAIASGSGDIEIKHLVNTKFTATVTATGDIELTGRTDDGDFTVNGSGDIDADEFAVVRLNAVVNGSGDIECRAIELLNGNIVGSGSIEIHGHPRNLNTTGRKSGYEFDH